MLPGEEPEGLEGWLPQPAQHSMTPRYYGKYAPLPPPKYKPVDALREGAVLGVVLTFPGLLLAAARNALTKPTLRLSGINSIMRTSLYFGGAGFTYAFVQSFSANLREKTDYWNHVMGGMASGGLFGIMTRSIPKTVGIALAAGTTLGLFDYTGGKLRPDRRLRDGVVDEVARKDAIRKVYRRPVEQTIMELGEGRGIYYPGYADRRKQRLKERYGIEVPDVQL